MKKIITTLITIVTLLTISACAEFAEKLELNTSDGLPVIVDTDMGFDDWMALLYVLNNPKIDVEAITINCTGETYCPQGGDNAKWLLELSGKSDIPIYLGVEPARTHDYQFPKVIREGATAMSVPGFEHPQTSTPAPRNAPIQIVQRAIAAGKKGEPVTILSIGTTTNIAQAITLAKENSQQGYYNDFLNGIKMVYKGGGAVGQPENGKLTNQNIPGNISIPGLFNSENKTAAWNIYSDALATQTLLRSGLAVTFITVNLSGQVAITEKSYQTLIENETSEAVKFVAASVKSTVDVQGGWDKIELDYWDPSVIVAALNPELVTTRYNNVTLCVDTKKGNTHGSLFVYDQCQKNALPSAQVSVYTGINVDAFYAEFIKGLAR